jgi:hypothetical protein
LCVASACAGDIDDTMNPDGGGGSGDMVDAGSTMPAPHVDITGPDVLPHVQLFANEMCAATTACTIGTREGHHPTANRAIDILVSSAFGKTPTDGNALGDKVAAWTLAHQAEHGVWYAIWRQRYNDGSGWDPMEDRGSITANHYDHVHVSFDATAP